jgi:hypothetical protein
MTVYAMKFSCLLFVVEMCLAALLGKAKGIVVLMAVNAGRFEGMLFGMVDLRFGLPVQTCRILKPVGPYVTNAGFSLLKKVPIAMGREVAIHTIHMYAPWIIVMS